MKKGELVKSVRRKASDDEIILVSGRPRLTEEFALSVTPFATIIGRKSVPAASPRVSE